MSIFNKDQETLAGYVKRCNARELTLMTATMNFVGYFMASPILDDQATAEGKVSQLSDEVKAFLYPYRLGNTQPLIDAIEASTLSFMDQDAKDQINGDLTPA